MKKIKQNGRNQRYEVIAFGNTHICTIALCVNLGELRILFSESRAAYINDEIHTRIPSPRMLIWSARNGSFIKQVYTINRRHWNEFVETLRRRGYEIKDITETKIDTDI